jgi:hypothetical protein
MVGQLAALIDLPAPEIDRAITLQNGSYLPHKRNLVAVLSRLAQLIALAADLQKDDQDGWWRTAGPDGRTPLERLRAGSIDDVCADLEERKAGPYDLVWDMNWPPEVASKRMQSRLESSVKPGDTLVAAVDGGRLKLRVLRLDDGSLTAEPIADTWVDPPFEEVAAETYRRLAQEYPDQVPPPG